MNVVADTLNGASGPWAEMMLAVLWQSTLLAVVVAVAVRLLRRASPTVRFWAWQIVAIKLLIMPLWTLPVAFPDWFDRPEPTPVMVGEGTATNLPMTPRFAAGGAGGGEGTTPTIAETPSAPSVRLSVASWLMLAWAAGVGWGAVRMVRGRMALGQLLRSASPPDDPNWAAMVAELSARVGLRRTPRVLLADFDGSPLVCGPLRPTLVLPLGLLDGLSVAQWRTAVLHELAHVRRGDLIWGWLPELARLFYFFHPVAHLASFQTLLERELACDGLAMRHAGTDERGYAAMLVEVAGHASAPPTLGAASAAAGLVDRT